MYNLGTGFGSLKSKSKDDAKRLSGEVSDAPSQTMPAGHHHEDTEGH